MRLFPSFPLAATALVATSLVLPVRAAEIPMISHAQLVKAISAKKVTILDVNGTETYKAGHIPGAKNYEKVQGNLKSVLPKNKNALVVAYCGSELCGAYKRAAEAAMKLGYKNVKHYSPGIKGWKKSGARIEKG